MGVLTVRPPSGPDRGTTTRAAARAALAVLLLAAVACDHGETVLDDFTGVVLGPRYGRTTSSRYLTMDDGVRIAITVHVPAGLRNGETVPTILELTRYWREDGGGVPYPIERAVERGFAYVVMDERGTGASFGTWPWALTDRALDDAGQVMDWVSAQPWSNGAVGATGVSYPGMSAQRLAAHGHPALRAIVPRSDMWDLYGDLIFPGGMFNEFFLAGWDQAVTLLDNNTRFEWDGQLLVQQPVDGDTDATLLEQAVAGHAGNMRVYDAIQGITFRDEPSTAGPTLGDMSTATYSAELAASGVAIYHWGSWLDGASADGVIRQFMASAGPQEAAIGAWTHGLGTSASPYHAAGSDARPGYGPQWEEALNFFDRVLRQGRPAADRVLRYVTMGTDEWHATSTWPIPGTVTQRLYLAANSTLQAGAPAAAAGPAADDYTVDFTARGSPEGRWHGPLTGEDRYPDRRNEDRKLLVYETAPLSEAVEITGYPVAHLFVASTHDDGAFIVYLEDVTPGGVVHYVTEGILRGIHRKVGTDPSPWPRPAPYHSFTSADAEPLVPGAVAELAIGLQPTSVLIEAGHRIRIAIAGHDASVFRRVPATGTPTISVQRNATYASYIELPVVPRQP